MLCYELSLGVAKHSISTSDKGAKSKALLPGVIMPVNRGNSREGGRRRSASESNGDHLNTSSNPASNPIDFNDDSPNLSKCISTPNVNNTGFIDDSYRNSFGTRLETRPVTRLQTRRENDNQTARTNQHRDEFTTMKGRVYEWVHKISSSVISIDVIKNDYSLFCTEIDHLISEILLGRGDFALVGEFGNLKDKLDAAKREAIQTVRESISRAPSSTPINQGPTTISSFSNSRNSNLDDVFNANDEIDKGGGVNRD